MTTILETKLRPPRPRDSAVARPRLVDRLRRGLEGKLLLVSAPPGFGKSTLVAQWIATLPESGTVTAWISLDTADDDPAVFWSYVAAAVATVAPDAAAGARTLLEGGQPRTDHVISGLINGLARIDTDLILVLDDLHVIESAEVAEGLAFLLDHLPSRVHLVILTRSDPALPLARMRARGELVEVRAADLRFTIDEATAYLNERMGLALGDADLAALEARTEGWIAALQLAALSMHGRVDVASFVASFAGDDRHVVDYLADEVLERQTDEVRAFLLSTSVLDRLTGSLCDALTGDAGGAAMLEALERANLFLVPLDDRRRWYRYHHLFADLLRARLLDQRPDDVPDLHRRASAWWQEHGEPAEAIGHAIAGGAFDRAADLIEVSARALRQARQEAALRRWLDALPEEVFESRPMLAIAHAGALLSLGETGAVEARLAAAERWAPAAGGDADRAAAEAAGMIVRHPTALGHLPSAIALHRAGLARMQGDLPATIDHGRRALAAAREDQPLERGAAAGILALAYWSSGDLETAHETWSEAVVDLERAGHRSDMLGGFMAMADIRIAQGRLSDARRTYERGLRLGSETSPPLRGTGDMHVGLGELHRERNDLASARTHLESGAALGETLGLPQNAYRWRVAMAGVRAAEGDAEGALQLLDEAERVYDGDFFPDVRPVASVRARLWVSTGRHADALAWARDRGATAGDDLSYLREHEHITLARALLARATADRDRATATLASDLIGRLLDAADAGGRGGSVVELLVLRAQACRATGDRDAAGATLDRALALAEPEGYARLFLDEGPPMVELLAETARRAPASYASRVLGAVGERVATPARRQPLVEPLSERELEVLRLLASDLDGPQIAAELFVSVNTLRTHTKNIFAKLGVNSRRAAVTRAAELRLLARDG